MTKKQIENKISAAVDNMVPADAYDKISEKLSSARRERTRITMTERKNISIRKIAYIAVAACLVLAIGIFGFSYYNTNMAIDSVIDIDVNPSIEITTNKSDRVLDVVAVNEDGIEILDGMDLKNSELKVAVNAVIGSMVQKGYFAELDNGILVTVQNKDSAKAEKLRSEVLSGIDAQLTKNDVSAPVINQTVTDNGEAEKFAADNKISYGKAVFILGLVEKDSSLVAADLAKMNIYDIAKLVNDKNIDIKDIVDYEYDDSIFENIADQIEDTNEDKYDDDKVIDTTGLISSDKAKSIALAHSGVKAADAVFERTELDVDDGVAKYEVEFNVGNVEYSYDINAITGAVIEFDKDIDD